MFTQICAEFVKFVKFLFQFWWSHQAQFFEGEIGILDKKFPKMPTTPKEEILSLFLSSGSYVLLCC